MPSTITATGSLSGTITAGLGSTESLSVTNSGNTFTLADTSPDYGTHNNGPGRNVLLRRSDSYGQQYPHLQCDGLDRKRWSR